MRKIDNGNGFIMREHNAYEREILAKLIKEGESNFGRSDAVGHLVVDYVNEEMLNRGLRIKIHAREFENPLPLRDRDYYEKLAKELYGNAY